MVCFWLSTMSHLIRRSHWLSLTNASSFSNHHKRMRSLMTSIIVIFFLLFVVVILLPFLCAWCSCRYFDAMFLLPCTGIFLLINRSIFISLSCLLNGPLRVDKDKKNSPRCVATDGQTNIVLVGPACWERRRGEKLPVHTQLRISNARTFD